MSRDILSYLNTVLAAEDDAITIINNNKEVLFWNEASVKTYNISQSDIAYQKITNYFNSDDLMVLEVLETKKPVNNIYHRPRKDKHVVINAAPVFNEENQIIGAVSVERDITQIVKLNDNLETTSAELNELRQKIYANESETPFSAIRGKSHQLQKTIQIALKAAKTEATTLILGESGTGKEICARAIHDASPRKDDPFIPVNCGAIPAPLFESELFGYEGGSFTGADRNGKAGKIEMADGGTLFLDEVGELPLEMQVKLLRVLQEKSIYRIGDSTGRDVNVRFIAATNQNLEQLMEEKKFRSDLFYRLNVIQVTMPPLRQRIDDIHELTDLFLKQFAAKYQVPIPEFKQDAFHLLLQYNWPGNVRELRNLMERIIILSEKPILSKRDLLTYFPSVSEDLSTSEGVKKPSLSNEKENIEKQLIEETLKQTNGNKSDAARRLGISRVTIYSKMKKYGIENQ
ncbi:sigma-54-dependent Fis family transcriptional regulator [Virgibacillus profundi]|uniref:Sigma-54-dependent Fis family transcriptional regulator n=1 Tax=Virgibacillus profundi TaxID=2024555 RepID=A0A2A2IC62_9BACI|nr:sigma 54-interacting transcriptional regulator [Virgibacillus profundi]PAV28864.1 sigma-54-dependent Fis family transcriptional regulator [Virgibacillus profundi]PXY53032.1 PAS domain-containing protein [Virgibacillus profundi]